MSQDFPRVYRLNGYGRILYYGFGSLSVVLFGGIGVYLGWFAQDKERMSIWAALIFLAFAASGVLLILAGRKIHVRLNADEIESVGVFMTRRMTRANIAGYRWMPMQRGAPQLWLYARYDTGHKLKLPQFLATDADFDAWFTGIENINVKEHQASLDELLEDPDMHGSREERLARLEKARRVARVGTAPGA